MAITPAQTGSGRGKQIADFMKGATDKAQKARLAGETKVKVAKQNARAAKPSRRQEIRQQRKADDRRGRNVDVRA